MEILFAINIIAFLVMGLDKLKARRGWWRIPESILFLLALGMGAAGILAGMLVFRHKIRHAKFLIGVPVLLVLNIICCYYVTSIAKGMLL